MRNEYDFSNAKRATEAPHLAKLQAESGKGYQTLINEALRNSLSPESAPLTAETLRKILHEELRAA